MECIQHSDGPIGEAVDDLEFQPLPIKAAENAAATLGPEIEGQQFLVHRP